MSRVLHINDYPADAGGGAEVVMARTVALLRRAGAEVDIFTGADLGPSRRTPIAYIDNAAARRALADRLAAFQPRIVHLHNFYHVLSPGILATLADHKRRRPTRVVMTAHDFHLACPNSGGSWFRLLSSQREIIDPARLGSLGYRVTRMWDQRGLAHSLLKMLQQFWNYHWRQRQRVLDAVICPSRFVQAVLAPVHLPTCWLPHPAPIVAHGPAQRANALEFVFAGRIEPEKGLFELLRDWPADEPARLSVIGAGADGERCRRLCAERGFADRVDFVGRLPHAQTLERIGRAHVLVQPARFLEAYGLTLIEALALGTNLLAARRGAVPEMIAAAGVGFLYELDNPASLADQLTAIRQAHRDGTLNRFDIASFLAERSEERHLEALAAIYQMPHLAIPRLRIAG